MQAKDIMTTNVITVYPDTSIQYIAKRLIENRISAVPVLEMDGRLVGIVHAVFHRSTWLPQWTCYLQDLYVDGSQCGLGTGAALIEAVADLARANGAGRLYWNTHETNATARRLYDRIATRSGFIQYRKAL